MPRVKLNAKLYGSGNRSRPKPLRRVAITGLAVLAIAGGSILLWRSGWPQLQAERAGTAMLAGTAHFGFSLQEVNIEGREHIGRDELLQALQVERGMPTLALDRRVMAARLQQLPWLSAATIERRLPGTLLVRLTERQPLARWQHQNQVQVIDREGTAIGSASVKDFASLPLVVGTGADERAYELLAMLADYPAIQKAMTAAVCVGERRWDLQLEPGIAVRLGEGKEEEGLKKLSALLSDSQLLNREVQAVDLRFPDRMIIERPPNAAANTKTAKGVIKH